MKRSRWIAGILAIGLFFGVVTAVFAFPYHIRWGDTLSHLAYRYGTSVNAIVQANPQKIVNPNLIYAGDTIEIPVGTVTPPPVTPPPVTPPPVTPPPDGTTYVVQYGDTLSSIARRFGTTVNAIADANDIYDVDRIYVGQILVIPGVPGGPGVPPPEPASFGLGGQTVNLANPDRMKDVGMSWVKFQYAWTAGEDANDLADEIQAARDNDLKVLLSITGAEAYPDSINFNSYVDFVRGVATLGPDAIEVWNEMNIDFEWPEGQINPSSYVNNMLAPAYQAIKQTDPDVMVIAGALAPTGFDNGTNAWSDDRYLAGMRSAGAASFMDCLGVHHNAGATSPNVATGHPGGAHYSWYFRPTLNVYAGQIGGLRPLCITELGYLSPEGFNSLPPAFSWAADTSVSEQAQWLAQAVQIAKNRSDVQMAIIYNVDFINYTDTDPQAGYAMLRPDGSCPACDTVKSVMNP